LRMPSYLIFQMTYKVGRWPIHMLVIRPQGVNLKWI
jgi:hypothetical protein